jgi:hypothetical protein
MSTTQISFRARVNIGGESVPIVSEIVRGADASADGVSKGFLFKLDLGPNDPPVEIPLGAIIGFIEDKLGAGAGSLAGNAGLATLSRAFNVSGSNFNRSNNAVVKLKSFEVNSSDGAFLFSFSLDAAPKDPAAPFLPLPGDMAGWLKVERLAISFQATKGQ